MAIGTLAVSYTAARLAPCICGNFMRCKNQVISCYESVHRISVFCPLTPALSPILLNRGRGWRWGEQAFITHDDLQKSCKIKITRLSYSIRKCYPKNNYKHYSKYAALNYILHLKSITFVFSNIIFSWTKNTRSDLENETLRLWKPVLRVGHVCILSPVSLFNQYFKIIN